MICEQNRNSEPWLFCFFFCQEKKKGK